jgi:murein DD-endopeptidase MepM/ murein hydrolase activator NlpD
MDKYSIVFLLLAFLIISSCNHEVKSPSVNEEITTVQPVIAYGIDVDSLNVLTGKVKRNEFLSDILLKYNVDYSTIDHIAKYTRDTFDVRKIRRGNDYVVICTNDSLQKALYFVYVISPTDYVLYGLTDSIYARRGHKPITITIDSIKGTIESSLWNALVNQNADPNLANELSEIYAWTIDFFGLRKGDGYTVIYEKLFVEDQYVGLGKVIAANFDHMGEDHYAFYFEQNDAGDYFDEKGNSLQRTFLKAPLRFTRISSRFSNSRLHPVLKIRRPHHGVDYAAPTGTPVHTVGDGVVVAKGYQKRGGGNYVKIKHNGTYTTSYAHLSGYAKGIVVGKKVKQGDLIGYVGKTGLATGPHLDFRFYRNGRAVDPLKVESPPSKPIDTAYRVTFDSIAAIEIHRLNSYR